MVGSVGTEQPPVLQPPVMRTFLLQDTLHILLHCSLWRLFFSNPCIKPSYDTHCRFFSTTIYPNKICFFLEERTPRKYQSRTFSIHSFARMRFFDHHYHHHHEVRLQGTCTFCLGLTHPDSHFLCKSLSLRWQLVHYLYLYTICIFGFDVSLCTICICVCIWCHFVHNFCTYLVTSLLFVHGCEFALCSFCRLWTTISSKV